MLEKYHYLHLPFDEDLSSKFLDNYLNWYDPQHIHFMKADLDDFEIFRHKLQDYTKIQRDTSPAYIMFNRFMERLDERSAFSKDLLHNDYFVFTNDERISLNRKTAPFPVDVEEAHKLWRERIRYEYLDEMLNRGSPKELARRFASCQGPFDMSLAPSHFRAEIVKFLDTRINRMQRNFREWDRENVLERYLTALATIYDPHSDYESRETFENFTIHMSLALFGIGAVLSPDDDGYVKIVSLQAGMPAAKSKKLKENDRIVSVAQGDGEPVDVFSMSINKVVDLIRGPKGTTVRLTIIPADAADPSKRTVVSLVRDEIKLEEEQAKAKIIESTNSQGQVTRLGFIDLPSFYASFSVVGGRGHPEAKSATLDVERLLEKLKQEKVDGVILDLRHNGGGSLPEAISLTGLFIKQGPVVQVRGSDGSVQVDEDRDPRIQYDGPLVVLTSKFSASASEIVAGALQDYGRAVVVGSQSTHGKGTVQTLIQLAPYLYMRGEFFTANITNAAGLGAVKFTTNAFYRITGSSTQLRGVIPDIQLPSTYDYLETEEGSEPYAMKLPDIQTSEFEKLNLTEPFLSELKKRSESRVASSKDFAYVQEDIKIVKKSESDKSASLNEHQRLKEADENERRRKGREVELKARKSTNEKIYDLNLKNGKVEMVEEKKAADTNSVAVSGNGTNHWTLKNPQSIDTNSQATATSGTNSTAKPATGAAGAADETKAAVTNENLSPEEKAPLDETKEILKDYIALIRGLQPVAVHQSGGQ